MIEELRARIERLEQSRQSHVNALREAQQQIYTHDGALAVLRELLIELTEQATDAREIE